MLLFFSFCIRWAGCPHDCVFLSVLLFFSGILRKFWMPFYLRFSNSHLYLCLLFYAVGPLFDVSRFFSFSQYSSMFFFRLVFSLFICTTFVWRESVFLIHSNSSFLCTHPDPNTNEQNYYLWTFIVWISFMLGWPFSKSFVATAILLGWLPAHVRFLQDRKNLCHFPPTLEKPHIPLFIALLVSKTANIWIRHSQTLVSSAEKCNLIWKQ